MNEPNISEQPVTEKQTTPMRCFTGALISGGLAYGAYRMMNAIAINFASKPIHSDNQIVVRLSIAVRTLVVGIATLGTGVFGFVALGLFILGLQLIIQKLRHQEPSN